MVIVKAMGLELAGGKVKSESIAELQKLHAFNRCHLQFKKIYVNTDLSARPDLFIHL